ncbi:MAG: hypothetical protein HOH33_11370 [Verrucomicrobia bacterium]|jgi:hypothetical protein|nr:hypothetical protein [Verrucomicrobiota bacterium]
MSILFSCFWWHSFLSIILFSYGTIGATEFEVMENEVWRVILSTTATGSDYSVKWNGVFPVNWDLSEIAGAKETGNGSKTISSTVGTSSLVPEPHEYAIMTGLLLLSLGLIRRKKELVTI